MKVPMHGLNQRNKNGDFIVSLSNVEQKRKREGRDLKAIIKHRKRDLDSLLHLFTGMILERRKLMCIY